MINVRTVSAVVRADEGMKKPVFNLIHVLVLCSLASAATSWFYQTPVTTAKAEQTDNAEHKAAAVEKKLQTVVTKDVPRLKAQIGCEHARGDVGVAAAYGAAPIEAIPGCPPISTIANLGKPKP